MEIKYDKIGINYNETRKADPYISERLFKHLNLKAGELFLDIGCGTGNYTNSLSKKGIDGIMGSLTIHHWDSREIGFKELYRILKPNGTIVVFTSTPK